MCPTPRGAVHLYKQCLNTTLDRKLSLWLTVTGFYWNTENSPSNKTAGFVRPFLQSRLVMELIDMLAEDSNALNNQPITISGKSQIQKAFCQRGSVSSKNVFNDKTTELTICSRDWLRIRPNTLLLSHPLSEHIF